MPTVQFQRPARQIHVGRFMPVPKRITELSAWYKTARQVISQIPDLTNTDWFITNSIVSLQEVVFKLQDTNGEQAEVRIDRTKRGLNA